MCRGIVAELALQQLGGHQRLRQARSRAAASRRRFCQHVRGERKSGAVLGKEIHCSLRAVGKFTGFYTGGQVQSLLNTSCLPIVQDMANRRSIGDERRDKAAAISSRRNSVRRLSAGANAVDCPLLHFAADPGGRPTAELHRFRKIPFLYRVVDATSRLPADGKHLLILRNLTSARVLEARRSTATFTVC